MASGKHITMQNAKNNKKDEFYTQMKDIISELSHYSKQFENKIILCNCDDPRLSNFYKYFVDNFDNLKLKKVICVCYSKTGQGYSYIYQGGNDVKYPKTEDLTLLTDDGDFRGVESQKLLEQSDIVVTNPPFSLFREYLSLLVEYKKDFLIIGNVNAITYKYVFSLIKDNKIWLGINLGRGISGFIVPPDYELYGTETMIDSEGNRIVSPNNATWFTTLDNDHRRQELPLTKQYKGNELFYPKYDNYDAIDIGKTKDIPSDYSGCMGVPITFLHKYNPNQFEIIKFRKGNDDKDLRVNGKTPYFRIIIRRKQCIECSGE